jgi:hypothetical protein
MFTADIRGCADTRGEPETPPTFFSIGNAGTRSDTWGEALSGADETDCTQDDGDRSMAGEECAPTNLFSRHRPPSACHSAGRRRSPRASEGCDDTTPQTRKSLERERARERGAGGKRVSENRIAMGGEEENSWFRRRRKVYVQDSADELTEGVWGLNWGRKKVWSLPENPLRRHLKALRERARGGIFAARTSPAKTKSQCADNPADVLVSSTSDHDADGDISESETLRHSTPRVTPTETRSRSIGSVRERVRFVAVRAKQLAETMGESWQKKRRHAKAQARAVRSDMILLPGGLIRRAWDCLGLLLLLLLMAVQVMNERWKSEHRGWLFFDVQQPYDHTLNKVQVLLDLFFIVDIFVNFRTAYLDEATGRYVKDARRIASHYSRHWLICDIFCAIPLDLLLDETPHVMEAQRKGKNRLKWLLRRTGALHVLRITAGTRPFRGARFVPSVYTHTYTRRCTCMQVQKDTKSSSFG